jgi:serine/threonine protein kinase
MSAHQLPTVGRTATREHPPRADPHRGPLVLGRYRLLRRLGSGAFGTVWHAHDERLDRDVAVKILDRDRIVGGRFEREARAAARLTHPGIVTLFEAGADDDGAYLVSELVRGATLATLLDAGRLSDLDILEIGIALCDALAHAHSQGVVHRDVKPSNVLVPEQPSTPTEIAKLTDFGVARVLGGDSLTQTSLTQTGEVIGTAAYMAPEQAEGRHAGAPADLYALALVLYEALTGVNPVRASTTAQRARRLGAHMPPLRRQRRDLPSELGQGLDHALRPLPRERGTVETLRAALTAARGGVSDQPGVVTSPWRTRVQRGLHRSPEPDPLPRAGGYRPAELEPLEQSPEELAHVRAPISIPARGRAGVVAAALAAWLATNALHPAPVPGLVAALIAGALVALLPRAGWIAIALTLVSALLLQNRPGAALVLAIGALLPMFALPLSGSAWPLSAVAPGLGAVGLAGAWPALAGLAGSPWRRAALGFTGWLWLVIAEPLAGAHLYLGSPHGTPRPSDWTGSLHRAIHDVLGPMISSGVLAPAVVWAAAALVLPWVVRGRSAALDLVRVVAWSAALVSATSAAVAFASGTTGHPTPRGAVLGALAAVAVALFPTALGLERKRRQSRAARSRLA